jgi:KDO2-lipid IV(A) lauroyltransferase
MARLVINKRLGTLAERMPLVQSMLRGVECGFAGLVWAATRTLPLEAASALGERIGAATGPRLRKHKHVLGNLRIVFPDREPAFIEATAAAIWRQIGRVLGEYPHLGTIFKEGRIELDARFDLDELRQSRIGWVFCALHQANWNLHAMGGALGGFPLSVLYLPSHNPQLERMVGRWRNGMPCGFIPVSQAPRPCSSAA